MQTTQEKIINLPYQLFTLVLCLLVVGIMFFDATREMNDEIKRLLTWIDYILCVLSFFDFLYQYAYSENRKKYMITWGWIDILSCIPICGWGRITRVFRILKLLKAIRTGQNLIMAISRQKGESALLSAVVILIFATLFGSVAILQCEMNESTGNIQNAPDAIWWTFCTIMKGGCENYDPVTIEGRIVAIVLMFIGAAFSATIFGFMAMILTSDNSNAKDDQ
jgi:voltage-gated potassium channel